MTARATRIVAASDASLLLVFDADATEAALERVHAWFFALRAAAPPWLLELHPAYASLLVEFDPTCATHVDVEAFLRALAPDIRLQAAPPGRVHELKVRYGGPGGPDLDDVARHTGLSPADVVALHGSTRYRVAFLGFSPGFAYLSGLSTKLATPRRSTPRTIVPAGSVAIGGAQTAVYATPTPGGWNVIGRVDVPLGPAWAEPGDWVRFVADTTGAAKEAG